LRQFEPFGAKLAPTGADEPLDIGFDQDVQHFLRHSSQATAVYALLQRFDRRHSVLGHWVRWCWWLSQITVTHLPGDRLSLTRAAGSMSSGITPDARTAPNFHH
jgi:hypothetical protein